MEIIIKMERKIENVFSSKNHNENSLGACLVLMVCIRKILILRVCGWPYLAAGDITRMAMDVVVGVMRLEMGVGGSSLRIDFVAVVDWKDGNHVLARVGS